MAIESESAPNRKVSDIELNSQFSIVSAAEATKQSSATMASKQSAAEATKQSSATRASKQSPKARRPAASGKEAKKRKKG